MSIVDNKVNFVKFIKHRGVNKTPFYAIMDGSTADRNIDNFANMLFFLLEDKGVKDMVIKPAHMADAMGLFIIRDGYLDVLTLIHAKLDFDTLREQGLNPTGSEELLQSAQRLRYFNHVRRRNT